METFGLDAQVELTSGPSDVTQLNDRGMRQLLGAIEKRFGVGLDPAVVARARSFSEIAEAIEQRRALVERTS
jgi:hypothetical protein